MTAATVEALRDLWEADIELAGSEAGPIPIITSPPETTWIWSDLHFEDRSALEAFDRPFADRPAHEQPPAPRVAVPRPRGRDFSASLGGLCHSISTVLAHLRRFSALPAAAFCAWVLRLPARARRSLNASLDSAAITRSSQ